MFELYAEGELCQAVQELAEATAATIGETSLVYAAAARAIETGRREDVERFLRHLRRLDEADQIRIAQKRDTMLLERWTKAVFGPAEPWSWQREN